MVVGTGDAKKVPTRRPPLIETITNKTFPSGDESALFLDDKRTVTFSSMHGYSVETAGVFLAMGLSPEKK